MRQNLKPALSTQAFKYRESLDVDLVFRMAQLWTWMEADLQKMYSKDKLEVRRAEWRRGALDDDLKNHCKLLDASFQIKDIRFISLDLELARGQVHTLSNGQEISDLEMKSMQSEFALLVARLSNEQKVTILVLF